MTRIDLDSAAEYLTPAQVAEFCRKLNGCEFLGFVALYEEQIGAISFEVSADVFVWATPDYRGENTLAIEVCRTDGSEPMIACDIAVKWSGDFMTDAAKYHNLVAPYLKPYEK